MKLKLPENTRSSVDPAPIGLERVNEVRGRKPHTAKLITISIEIKPHLIICALVPLIFALATVL